MLAIAFVHNGYTEARISVPQDVAVYGKSLLAYVVHSLKYGVQAVMGMGIAFAIVANI